MTISLIDGWFPWALQLAAAALFLVALGWRDRTWRRRWAPIALAVAALLTAAGAFAVVKLSGITDPIPLTLWFWPGVAIASFSVLGFGWRSARWWRRLLAPAAALLAMVAAVNAANIVAGFYPTLDGAIGDLSGAALPQQVALDQLATLRGRTDTGRIVQVDIPETASGFAHRPELVYLPPAWFGSLHRPQLPVLEMIGAEYAAPNNWVRAGDAVRTADAYAAQHHGYAPILVFTDATNGFRVDTECVDGPHGNAEDHLVKDIPPYIEKTFDATSNPHKWGVVGWSMGGTCAIDLTVEHPDVFDNFVDISGDIGPNIGDKRQTIQQLYGGNAAAWAAHDPRTVLSHHQAYKGVFGWFEAGDQEQRQVQSARALSVAANKAGIQTSMTVQPGKHVWQFGAAAFARLLPSVSRQLGVPGARI